ncbi:MAG: leucine-rich repeat domain-containing protein [Muribaculaceae bacterium]|nr:leucine-rich repeat domain-containing protein [Muribaculaceae bacterium]MDE6768168.1 leucine-rich repeat domain-containing protein [Muribaculaceae bacterium]
MNNILKYLTLGLLLILMGCSNNDEPDNGVKWDDDAKPLVKRGIDISYLEQAFTLNFTATETVPMSVNTHDNWIHTNFDQNSRRGQIEIMIDRNDHDEERSGSVRLIVGRYITDIRIDQKAPVNAVPKEKGYVVENEANSISIPVKANGTLSVNLYFPDSEWAKISDIKKDPAGDSDDWIISMDIDENTGLGRFAGIKLEVNGVPPMKGGNLYIVQQPGLLNEDMEVELQEPGMLQILLGSSSENLCRINNLTLKGNINAMDIAELDKLIGANNMTTTPLSVDLSNTGLCVNINPFEAYGWQPATTISNRFDDPQEYLFDVLSSSYDLVHVSLPKNTTCIPSRAFSGICHKLKSIHLSMYLTEIGDYAFANCPNLTEINIPEEAMLLTLGSHAFDTGSVIESLTLSEYLNQIADDAFAGCKVKNLHVHWTTPQPLEIVPQTEGCTLYVPQGTADIYRSTSNWCNFKQIVEE